MSVPPVSCSREMVRRLQENAARALPADHAEHVGGWWLRHSTSCAWWAGTVLPHAGAGPEDLVRRGRRCGEVLRRAPHGRAVPDQPTSVPPSPRHAPGRRGYRRQSPMSLKVAATTRVVEQAPGHSPRVRLDHDPTDAWFEVWHAVHGSAGDRRAEWNMLGRVERPSAYASAIIGSGVVAVGRVVADGGWAGVFGMATLPHARGKGAGRRVLTALAQWAGAHQADHLYLQVERDNLPAQRLYEGAGFGDVCGYHYRTAG